MKEGKGCLGREFDMAAFLLCWNCKGGMINCEGDLCKCDKCGFDIDKFWNDGMEGYPTE